MLAVMTLSAVEWSYFCIEYCTDVYTVITDFSAVNTFRAFLGSSRITNIAEI